MWNGTYCAPSWSSIALERQVGAITMYTGREPISIFKRGNPRIPVSTDVGLYRGDIGIRISFAVHIDQADRLTYQSGPPHRMATFATEMPG